MKNLAPALVAVVACISHGLNNDSRAQHREDVILSEAKDLNRSTVPVLPSGEILRASSSDALRMTALPAQTPPRNESERELFDLLNHERATQNLSALKWDDALFKAARQHALLMLNLNSLEHQLPGEPTLEERLAAAGAHFTYIAENVAIGSNAQTIHSGWMNSPGHRKNILNPRITAVGIAAVSGNGGLFAVEDFSHTFLDLSREQQEKQVEALLVKQGFRVNARPVDARKACNGAPKMNFLTSFSMVKFEVPDLSEFSPEVEKKIRAQSFRNVTVGACEASNAAGFSGYRIVLLFY